MAQKKSFKDNPALQFITAPEDQEPEAPEQPAPISTEKPPAGYKVNPLYVETKTRRLQLVLQPSLYERVKARARASGLSINEYVHQTLDNATRED